MNLYVAQQSGLIRKITPPAIATYSVTPSLPAGLSLGSTGTISGTPTIFSAAQNYTITATNIGGSDTYTISIAVQEPVDNTLYPTTTAADEITEVSAILGGTFAPNPTSENIDPAHWNLSAYGTSANLGKIYSMSVTGVSSGGTIWGSNNLYTHDSYIARAAVHAGILSVGQTGTVYLKLSGSQNSYPSSTANGITSNSWGFWYYSYEFVSAPSTTITAPTVASKGIVYSAAAVSTAPTIANTVITATATNNDPYSLTLTGLTPGTTYYARAYATNAVS